MEKRRLGIVLLCLASACAHGKSSTERAQTEEPKTVARTAPERDRMVDAGETAADEERVELPDGQRGRGRMASAGRELPDDGAKPDRPESAETYGTEADNTRVNERDRGAGALTPMDQSEAEDDRELTQKIRKAVIGDDGLSFSAKNVKIITRDGHVTLRGSVKSAQERTTIERLASDAAGPGRVTNELEVAD